MQVIEGVEIVDGVEMFRISSVDDMDPFLMTVVGNSDLWMFVSSTGGLTAGRVEARNCIFPYETDDRLHHLAGRVGPATLLRIGGRVWEPFGASTGVERSILKSTLGHAVVFEEHHRDLGLTIRARWAPSDRFGWVRTVWLSNPTDGQPVTVEVVDGLLDVMPWGVGVPFQQQLSNLANAYRRSEIVEPGVGVYSLEALIVDIPEPAESLRATTVWSTGLDTPLHSLDPGVLSTVRAGGTFVESRVRTGRPGSFLVRASHSIEPGRTLRWHVVADAAQTHADVSGRIAHLRSGGDLSAEIDADIERCAADLRRIVAAGDGIQTTGSPKTDAHHLANTLFNVMRGGIFSDGYTIDSSRFASFVGERNRRTHDRHADWLVRLPDSLDVDELRSRTSVIGDPNLTRLAHEYLPLTFSRRHGDPSRPWNQFAIRVRDEAGDPLLSYQGNWRDIFQNWEALCRTYPAYLPSMIAKFVNATTLDGFNPYRITSDGIDWEIPDPDDPWSGIGYWGDHQIVYLHRLLHTQQQHDPNWLRSQLPRRIHSFAAVPYRIAPFDELVADPKHTIDFDAGADAQVADRVADIGADGRLVADADGEVVHATLIEKLLIPVLAKLSNFVPRGGIWMNTQRPEWNDANNALVGHGLSMVTLAHLRRYLRLLDEVASDLTDELLVSEAVVAWLGDVSDVLVEHESMVGAATVDDGTRFEVVEALVTAFDRYRARLAESGPSDPVVLPLGSLRALLSVSIRHLDDSLMAAHRPDGMYDAYNLVEFGSADGSRARTARVSRLAPMLEGQVATISSGRLDVDEVASLVERMYESDLYRPDVDTFVLYPATVRPSFLERNQLPPDAIEEIRLLSALADADDREIVVGDVEGRFHFNPDITNEADLAAKLDALAGTEFAPLVADDRGAIAELYEQVFRHHEFTGRSSTMYAYEGIGSVYWHMVAKLLLAVQESILEAPHDTDERSIARLRQLYERVRGGLGFNRSAAEFGAFPTDPYSHTPAHAGAQQPGMTGQVKEELLTRWAELGVTVEAGSIRFGCELLDAREFRREPGLLGTIDVHGREIQVEVPVAAAAFSLCRVPIVVHAVGGDPSIEITRADGTRLVISGAVLDEVSSRLVFDHTGEITRLDVHVRRADVHESERRR